MTEIPRKSPASLADFVGDAFAQYGAGLERFLVQRLRSRQMAGGTAQAIAQDIAQETYLRLLRIEDKDLIRHPQAYLYRIAANLVYEFRLREVRAPVTYDTEMMEHRAASPPELPANEPIERLCAAEELSALLAQLPPTYRAVLVLRKRDGLSNIEIGRVLKLSPHTVKKYLVRALTQLRAARWADAG